MRQFRQFYSTGVSVQRMQDPLPNFWSMQSEEEKSLEEIQIICCDQKVDSAASHLRWMETVNESNIDDRVEFVAMAAPREELTAGADAPQVDTSWRKEKDQIYPLYIDWLTELGLRPAAKTTRWKMRTA